MYYNKSHIDTIFNYIETKNIHIYKEQETNDLIIYNLEIANIKLNKKYNNLLISHNKLKQDYFSVQEYCKILQETNTNILEKFKKMSIWDYLTFW